MEWQGEEDIEKMTVLCAPLWLWVNHFTALRLGHFQSFTESNNSILTPELPILSTGKVEVVVLETVLQKHSGNTAVMDETRNSSSFSYLAHKI